MNRFPHSFAAILPVAFVADGNRLAWAMGHQAEPTAQNPGTYSVPLSPTGQIPATHMGCLNAATSDAFVQMFALAKGGQLPSQTWANYGLTVPRVLAVMNAIRQVQKSTRDYTAAWEETLQANGLQQIRNTTP